MDKRLERILPRVQKPARYTGGEYNQIIKDKTKVDIRLAFCFPDTYEIGMSNLGMSILYHTMNSLDYVWCERVYAPWGDMYEEMKKANIPLYALESGDALGEFDAIAFSIGYGWRSQRCSTCWTWAASRSEARTGQTCCR